MIFSSDTWMQVVNIWMRVMTDDVLVRIVICLLGICGFLVAKHIRNHKTKDTPLVCMVGFDCHTVVHSDYSKFFGIPVEILGMTYYGLIFFSYLFFVFFFEVLPGILTGFMIIVTHIALLFSLYLIYVQIFILKKGCSWCIVSAIISACIFILTIHIYDINFLGQIFL